MPFVTSANTFTLIVFQENQTTGNKWRNSIDIEQTAGTPQPADTIVVKYVELLRRFLRTDAMVTGLELRNWTRGNVPFSQEAGIWKVPVSLAGLKTNGDCFGSEGSKAFGKEVVARVDKVPVSGIRPGRMFIRGCIDNDDAQAQTGSLWAPVSSPVVNNGALQIYLATSGTDTFFDPAHDPHFVIVRYSKKFNVGPITITIGGLVYVDVTTNKAKRKDSR